MSSLRRLLLLMLHCVTLQEPKTLREKLLEKWREQILVRKHDVFFFMPFFTPIFTRVPDVVFTPYPDIVGLGQILVCKSGLVSRSGLDDQISGARQCTLIDCQCLAENLGKCQE